jgi:hypothetical protein
VVEAVVRGGRVVVRVVAGCEGGRGGGGGCEDGGVVVGVVGKL